MVRFSALLSDLLHRNSRRLCRPRPPRFFRPPSTVQKAFPVACSHRDRGTLPIRLLRPKYRCCQSEPDLCFAGLSLVFCRHTQPTPFACRLLIRHSARPLRLHNPTAPMRCRSLAELLPLRCTPVLSPLLLVSFVAHCPSVATVAVLP
jgi:hypothetical protein